MSITHKLILCLRKNKPQRGVGRVTYLACNTCWWHTESVLQDFYARLQQQLEAGGIIIITVIVALALKPVMGGASQLSQQC